MQKIIRISSALFIILYFTSALLQKDFIPTQHFFCDLLNLKNLSGYLAIGALISISTFISTFFIWFTEQTEWSKSKKLVTKTGGIISAIFTAGIFSNFHDEFILTASIIGIIPVTFISIEMIKNWKRYSPILGFITLGFLAFYNIIFYKGILESFWPIIQKTSILLCVIWVNWIVIKTSFQKNN